MNTVKAAVLNMSDNYGKWKRIKEGMAKPTAIGTGDKYTRLIVDTVDLGTTEILKDIESADLDLVIRDVLDQVYYVRKKDNTYKGIVNIDTNSLYWRYARIDLSIKDIRVNDDGIYFKYTKVPDIEFHILT